MSDEEKYSEKSKSETKTKTGITGEPKTDAAGEPIKETTTETEGTKEKNHDQE